MTIEQYHKLNEVIEQKGNPVSMRFIGGNYLVLEWGYTGRDTVTIKPNGEAI